MKHEIEIPGLLEKGYRAVAYRLPSGGDDEYTLCDNNSVQPAKYINFPCLIIKKIQPRRIKVADTGEVRQPKEGEYVFNNGNLCLCRKPERWGNEHQIWRLVEEE